MNDHKSFLRAIVSQPDDTSLRLVYADWLEERGDARADFLRLEERLRSLPPEDPGRAAVQQQVDDLRAIIGPKWLAMLDRTPIENCEVKFAFKCPKRWELLQTTADSEVRFCESCRKNVHYCSSVAEAREHAWEGHCVALDSRLERTEGDLEQQEFVGTLGIIAFDSDADDLNVDEDRPGDQ